MKCSKCLAEKPETEFHWAGVRHGKKRRRSICKPCTSVDASSRNSSPRGQAYSHAHLLKRYGLTPEHFSDMLAAQGGRCAICRTDKPGGFKSRRFHVDHDHKTGKVRALLCHPCNVSLGHFKDNPSLLMEAAFYILAHRHRLANDE